MREQVSTSIAGMDVQSHTLHHNFISSQPNWPCINYAKQSRRRVCVCVWRTQRKYAKRKIVKTKNRIHVPPHRNKFFFSHTICCVASVNGKHSYGVLIFWFYLHFVPLLLLLYPFSNRRRRKKMKENVLLRENYLILHSVTMAKARKKKSTREWNLVLFMMCIAWNLLKRLGGIRIITGS